MDASIIEKVVEQLKAMPHELQWRVLEFARSLALSAPRGTSGRHLLCFASAIPYEDVQMMQRAIEEGCERVDLNGW
ncbi:MAG: hypothetical protein ACP5R2_11485 [Anaerolineae bacterium]